MSTILRRAPSDSVLDEGQSVAAAARDLGLTESSLRNWVDHARADRTQGNQKFAGFRRVLLFATIRSALTSGWDSSS